MMLITSDRIDIQHRMLWKETTSYAKILRLVILQQLVAERLNLKHAVHELCLLDKLLHRSRCARAVQKSSDLEICGQEMEALVH